MTVLVTGAAGFVGAAVVRELVASGTEVAALVRPGHPRPRLKGVEDKVEVIEADLADTEVITKHLGRVRPEACIHAAWYAEPGQYLDSPKNLDSLRAGLDLLEHLAEVGCKHVVGVGTCFEYEIGAAPVKEDSTTRPLTLYAASKLAFMLVATRRAPQLGMGFAWARLFYLYGPGEDERRLIPSAVKALSEGREFPTSDGATVRDYLHISDVASGLCATSAHRLDGAFNVCSGEPVTIAALMQALGELLGRPELVRLGRFPKRDWDPPYVCGDSSRLRTEANWSPRYNLRDGLADTIEWCKGAT